MSIFRKSLLAAALHDFALLMDENASKVISEHESITVNDDIFDQFMAACETAKEPNAALKNALSYTREQGIK